jgi:hypothetical protein
MHGGVGADFLNQGYRIKNKRNLRLIGQMADWLDGFYCDLAGMTKQR